MAAGGSRERWAPAVLGDVGEDDSEVYVLGLRETAEGDSWAVLFMECLDGEDEQEIDLGMDTYCLVVEPRQRTSYGGVLECELADGRLRLVLTEEAAKTLGTPRELNFELRLRAEQMGMVRRGLQRVLTSGRADAVPSLLTM
jgi:Immunity protein 10